MVWICTHASNLMCHSHQPQYDCRNLTFFFTWTRIYIIDLYFIVIEWNLFAPFELHCNEIKRSGAYLLSMWLNEKIVASLQKGTKLRIADFVHGADGLGNQNFPPPKGKPVEESAAGFLVNQAKSNPGKVTVVALGPLTNIALVGNMKILCMAFSCYSSSYCVSWQDYYFAGYTAWSGLY